MKFHNHEREAMHPSTVSGVLDQAAVGWVRPQAFAAPSPRRCAVEDLIAGVARGLVEAQLALDLRGDERMKMWEEDGIPPSATLISGFKMRLTVSSTVGARRDLSESTRIMLAPRRRGSSQIVFGFRRGAVQRGRP